MEVVSEYKSMGNKAIYGGAISAMRSALLYYQYNIFTENEAMSDGGAAGFTVL
jgi:hypothetical protein